MKRLKLLLVLLTMLVVPSNVFSCGPWFEHVFYSYTLHPDLPLGGYAAGELGIVRPTYARSYLYVAYMYLGGKRFSPTAQKELVAFWQYRFSIWPDKQRAAAKLAGDSQAAEQYTALRKQFAPALRRPIEQYRSSDRWNFVLNCHPDAFRTAAATLRARAKRWGATSRELQHWLAGQDYAFTMCSETATVPSPAPLPERAPALLRADRDYQMAAALFYRGDYTQARAQFARIAAQADSPWRQTAAYVVVRTLIREATEGSDADKRGRFKPASDEIERLLKDPRMRSRRRDLLRLRAFVEFRLRPEQRARELARALQDPGNPNLSQDLWDFLALADKALGEEEWWGGDKEAEAKMFADTRSFRRGNELADWIITFQSSEREARQHAIRRWRETGNEPWLIAAITKPVPSDDAKHDLVAAAEALPESSPAFVMANYHAARLLLPTDPNAARKHLARLAPTGLPPSAANDVQALRALAASSLPDFLQNAAAQRVAAVMDDPAEEIPFDRDSQAIGRLTPRPQERGALPEVAQAFNTRLPLATWLAAASDENMPARVRAQIALAGWARAIVLEKPEAAVQFAQIEVALQPADRNLFQSFLDAPVADRLRAGVFLLANLPGARPFLTVDDRKPRLDKIDNYRDNWWCPDAGSEMTTPNFSKQTDEGSTIPPPAEGEVPAFLSAEERTAGAAEWAKLAAAGSGPKFVSASVLAWAEQAPNDSRLPEAMFRAVRVERYSCGDAASRRLTEKVFRMLDKRYPKSPWTLRSRKYH